MVRTLEFIGEPGPHRDIERFVASLKQARPSMSEREIVTAVRRGNAAHKPRWHGSHWQLFGADILSADLTSLDVWPLLHGWWQTHLHLFPLDEGERIAGSDAARTLKAAMETYGVHRINRRSLLIPAGLSRSYVWTRANAWQQEVTDADVEIIRTTPMLNLCFRDPNRAHGPVTSRSYEFGAADRHGFRSFDDLEAYRKDDERTPQWSGV